LDWAQNIVWSDNIVWGNNSVWGDNIVWGDSLKVLFWDDGGGGRLRQKTWNAQALTAAAASRQEGGF
jgi:hypothetical protein